VPDELARRFADELSAVDGTPHPSGDPTAVALELAGLEPTLVAVEDDPTVEPVAVALADAGHEVLRPSEAGFRDRLADAALGVTGCTVAIADTGTLLLTADPAHPRATSLLPRAHLAVVEPDRLVSSLDEALGRIPTPAPSAVTLVTGPSRSADIEQILTLGVHGPARVHVVLP
jgi:L-lactate utilization protein LutC